MYTEILDDPKIQLLPGNLFKTWVYILAVASRYGGEIPVAELPHQLGRRVDFVHDDVSQLIARGLLTYGGGLITPHNWHGRQYKSDKSAERMRQLRARRRRGWQAVTRVTEVTAPEKKVSKKERERAKKWVADLEARLAAEFQPTNVTSLDALRNLTPLGKWKG